MLHSSARASRLWLLAAGRATPPAMRSGSVAQVPRFSRALSAHATASNLPDWTKRMIQVDLSEADRNKYFLRSSGPKVTAKYCPWCHPCKNETDLYKLEVQAFSTDRGDMQYHLACWRCKGRASGSKAVVYHALEAGLARDPLGSSPLDRPGAATAALAAVAAPAATADDHSMVAKAGAMLRPGEPPAMPNQAEVLKYPATLMGESWDSSTHPCVTFLKSRGLTREVCELYRVGYGTFSFLDAKGGWQLFACVTFPWLGRDGEFGPGATGVATSSDYKVLRTKIRGLDNKAMQRIVPAGGVRGLFGWNTIPDDCDTVVLTEGEFDAMSVFQATKRPTLSVPNGANSFSPELLPALKRFKRIILWYDDDKPGAEGCEAAAHKLGLARCAIVRTTQHVLERAHTAHPRLLADGKAPKDANDLLRLGYDLNVIIDSAQPIRHEEVLSFDDLRAAVRHELSGAADAGYLSRALPTLSKILGPHRLGELTIVTGPTGSGKTTFLSQLSLDYCLQGVPTLWGSFEIKNTRLVAMMIKQLAYCGGLNWRGTPAPDDQYAGALKNIQTIDFTKEDEFNKYADELDSLDLYFLRFFGSTSVDKVIDALEHAVQQHDVKLIVLDNLQFMISGHGGSGPGGQHMNKFEAQERALDQFRAFATKHQVHIVLVMHPRKEAEGLPLTIESISGTAKASQEADNIIILQKDKDGSKTLEVKKNRFSGDLGAVSLGFNRAAKTFRDLLAHGDE